MSIWDGVFERSFLGSCFRCCFSYMFFFLPCIGLFYEEMLLIVEDLFTIVLSSRFSVLPRLNELFFYILIATRTIFFNISC